MASLTLMKNGKELKMWKYDGLTYPDIGAEMLKHKRLGPILRAHMKGALMYENYLFLDALAAGVEINPLYRNFIATDARYRINVSGDIINPMIDAAKMGDFSSPIWDKSLRAAKFSVNYLIEVNVPPVALLKNTAFMAYHKSRKWKNKGSLIKKYKLSQETKKVAKILDMELTEDNYQTIAKAAVALQYEPKSDLKEITAIANSSKKKKSASSVKSAIMKAFKIK